MDNRTELGRKNRTGQHTYKSVTHYKYSNNRTIMFEEFKNDWKNKNVNNFSLIKFIINNNYILESKQNASVIPAV